MYKLTFEDVLVSWRKGSNCALGSSTAQISAASTLLRQVYIVTDSHPVHHPGSDRIAFFSHTGDAAIADRSLRRQCDAEVESPLVTPGNVVGIGSWPVEASA